MKHVFASGLNLFILCILLPGGLALSTITWAGGTGHKTVTVVNDHSHAIEVRTWNGNESGPYVVRHSVYIVNPGGSRDVKAHGRGTGGIRVGVLRSGIPAPWCSDGHKLYDMNTVKVSKGSTVTITKCTGNCTVFGC